MNVWQKIKYTLAIISQGTGVLFFALSIYFIVSHYLVVDNNFRNEYFNEFLCLVYATGFSLSGALLAFTIRSFVTTGVFRALTMPALIIGASLLVWYFWALAYSYFFVP